jgi:hypothetical protein
VQILNKRGCALNTDGMLDVSSKSSLRDFMAFLMPGFLVLATGWIVQDYRLSQLTALLPAQIYVAAAIVALFALITGRITFHIGSITSSGIVALLKWARIWKVPGSDKVICRIWSYLDQHEIAFATHERMVINALFLEGMLGAIILSGLVFNVRCLFWGLAPWLVLYWYTARQLHYLQSLIMKELD